MAQSRGNLRQSTLRTVNLHVLGSTVCWFVAFGTCGGSNLFVIRWRRGEGASRSELNSMCTAPNPPSLSCHRFPPASTWTTVLPLPKRYHSPDDEARRRLRLHTKVIIITETFSQEKPLLRRIRHDTRYNRNNNVAVWTANRFRAILQCANIFGLSLRLSIERSDRNGRDKVKPNRNVWK